MNVDLVVLNLSVRDRNGQFAAGLLEKNFDVFEDGVRQTIRLFRDEDIPVTVGLVVDHSGSMRHKLAEVVAAARTFVQASSAEDEMFVVNFSDQVTLGLPPNIRFTNRVDELARAIANTPAAGMTSLYDSLLVARAGLENGSREKKVLLVVSDGGDNASKHRLSEVLKLTQKSKALIYTIGLFDADDPDRNPGVLRRLADSTGGEAYFPGRTQEVITICERIARDIRHQYTIGYVSAKATAPGTYRAIQVLARGAANRKLSVRTRPGYVTGEEPK
ncbi:MAG: VWA domain-containing protein [Bryobacteraceae bacterium]|nr:VWA domain-containing protein [Bryobacteraceae bacterium]